MARSYNGRWVFLIAMFLAAPASGGAQEAGEGFGRVPLCFEPNLGQAAAEARFIARAPGYALFLRPTEALLRHPGGALRMRLVGGDTTCAMRGADARTSRSNYLRGSDPACWITGVPHVGKVVCEGVYPGINLVYYGNPRELEFDFVVAPGADPGRIRLSFDSALRIDARGGLEVEGAGGTVTLRAPVLLQGKKRIDGSFRLLPDREVGFDVGPYDRAKDLVIDPVLVYSTYLGGSDATGASENCNSIAVDGAGCAYVTGITQSLDFPTANPFQSQNNSTTTPVKTDAFVTKFSANGASLVYSTYLGGDNLDVGRDIVVDSAGCAYVTGSTRSSDFPTVNALQAAHAGGVVDAFLAKLDASGSSLVYSTYLGGSGDDLGHGVAIDSAGRGHVTGSTNSPNFPTANAHQGSFGGGNVDAFLARFEADGASLAFSTYLGGGGTGGAGTDAGYEIAVDASGNAVVTGWTFSSSFPTVNPIQSSLGGNADAFVARFDSGGTCVFATYLGGSGADFGRDVAVDAAGDAYVVGETASANFPTTSAAYQKTRPGASDAFVAKIDFGAGALAYSTYLGSKGDDYGYGIAVDGAGRAHVAGITGDKKFPVLNAVQATLRGATDAFVTKLNSSGSGLVYSTYLGGSLAERSFAHIALDGDGAAYVCGLTHSTDFPRVNPFQAVRRGVIDGFVAKIAP